MMKKPLLKIIFGILFFGGCTQSLKRDPEIVLAISPEGPGAEMATLELNIADQNFEKIRRIRNKALKQGRLIRPKNDYVPARLQTQGKIQKIKIRLKGDFPDHWTDKTRWSFKVKLKDKKTLWEMSAFSIQRPAARRWLWDWLAYAWVKELGLAVPKNGFVRVVLNGKDLGVYQIEEALGRKMSALKADPSSALLRFEDSYVWEKLDAKTGSLPSRQEARLSWFEIPYHSKSRKKSLAMKNFNAFRREEKKTSEVFNLEAMAHWLAFSDLFSAYHGLSLTNVAFEEKKGKLAPVLFDPDAGLQNSHYVFLTNIRAAHHFQGGAQAMVANLLSDPAMLKAYRKALRLQSDLDRLESFFLKNEKVMLQAQVLLNPPDSVKNMRRFLNARGEQLRLHLEGKLGPPFNRVERTTAVTVTYKEENDKEIILEFKNNLSEAVRIKALIQKEKKVNLAGSKRVEARSRTRIKVEKEKDFAWTSSGVYDMVLLFQGEQTGQRWLKTVFPKPEEKR